MQCVEPSACLVNTFGNKIGRIYGAAVKQFLVLERIVYLSVRHGTGIEPHVNEVELACHYLAGRRYKLDVINVRTVQVNLVIVLLAVVTRNETFILIWVACHDTGSNSLLNLVVKFLYRTDADSLAILTGPDRERSTPVAATAKVPVIEVLEPLAETACTCRLGFPCDSPVELAHALLHLRCTNKPAVERIVEHRLVGAPAVRIVVYMLLYLESDTTLLHYHAEGYIKSLGLCGSLLVVLAVNCILRVIRILHICTREL